MYGDPMSGKDISDARHRAGLSQQKMSNLLGIPKRTIESWEVEDRSCPAWVERLIIEKLAEVEKGED
jgi:DNA-binding transcriptional regulator YiaG